MNASPELIAAVQRERERQVDLDRLARLVARMRACCNPTLFDRLARAMRRTPSAC